ncbi:MAG: hypothetical protein CBD56_01180 [Candidatus Pelagibacter sp. TMED196]|mgnify:CR=1 FL=1|nr:MAG: hypothetical protein CBD56_01180 [Candidatus Pelagibacter sp. TMED196]
MDRSKNIENKLIQKNLTENFLKLMPTFYEMESSFLTGVYKRYGDLEGGNIVIYFARDCHLEILRKREKDLNFNLSLENFWDNHKNVFQSRKKIILVSQKTGLPKETTRRKILSLIKKKHLKKGDKNKLFWEPETDQKESYIKIIDEEIVSLSKFIFEQTKLLSLSLPISKIEKEIKNNYSFYWYHFLNVQLEYIKFWQDKLKDLEMLLIGVQVLILTLNSLKRKFSNFTAMMDNQKNLVNFSDLNGDISATSISDITGIPRATCIRKLEKFVKMKVLEKNNKSKRYSLVLDQTTFNPMLQPEWMKHKISILSNFSFIVIKGLVK